MEKEAIRKRISISEKRKYLVKTVAEARSITVSWLRGIELDRMVKLGLPEIDDRYHYWRVPLCSSTFDRIGELVLDAYTSEILEPKSSSKDILEARLLQKPENGFQKRVSKYDYPISSLRNSVGQGDCIELLEDMPAASVDLIFTSPPYFNARPEYSDYEEYEKYLDMIRQVIKSSHRVLNDGRFFVINTSPVLLRRASRSQSSKRIAVPFDLHRIFTEEGYDFIDDIIWLKPEGAGWATGRGRRFAADRQPLQYKAVPVTEYVLVYRKRSDLLIDWHLRNHPDPTKVEASKINGEYERTNVWRINPVTNSKHPAAFPLELARKVISYYSFKDDVILDPFAGSGTAGIAAIALGRRFVLFENNPEYITLIRESLDKALGNATQEILWLNCAPSNGLQLF